MSMDVCPKCREQQVMAGKCGYCGWFDYEEVIRELREENLLLRSDVAALSMFEGVDIQKLRAQVRDYEEALRYYADTVGPEGVWERVGIPARAREAFARWKVPNGN